MAGWMSRLLTDCFLPLLLNVPLTEHPQVVTIEIGAPLVHLDFLGVHFGRTFDTLLQSLSKVSFIVHRKFTFPHFTWPTLTVSSTAREELMTRRRRVKLESLILSKVLTN